MNISENNSTFIKVKQVDSLISEFLENIRKARFDIVGALLNSQSKCLTMVVLGDTNDGLTPSLLHQAYQERSNNVWRMNPRSQASYCENTLIPKNLVENKNGKYYLTQFGREVGLPIAKYLLYASANLKSSLMTYFGATNSKHENISAMTRSAILLELSKNNGKIREIDLEVLLGIDRKVLGPHLTEMAKIGLIDYRSHNFEEKGLFKYRLIDGANFQDHQHPYGLKTISSRVIEVISDGKMVEFEVNEIVGLLCEKHEDYKKLQTSTLKVKVGKVLASFVKQGLCINADYLKSGEVHSEIILNIDGIEIINILLLPLMQATHLESQTLDDWGKITLTNTQIERSIAKYYRESPYANKLTTKARIEQILKIVGDEPGIRPTEIQKIMDYHVRGLLGKMVKSGLLRTETDGIESRYFLQ